MTSRILLDFDGIIFRNRNVHNKITEKSIQFLKSKGNFHSDKYVCYFNSTRYPIKGHSALILPKGNTEKAIKEYNDTVFDEPLMHFIRKSVNEDDQRHVRRILEIKRTLPSDATFHLCTNTPLRYCEEVMNSLALPLNLLFDTSCSFTSDNNQVKPQPTFWDSVEKHPYFHNYTNTIELVDDSIVNIVSLKDRARWMTHYINNDQNLYYFLKSLKNA